MSLGRTIALCTSLQSTPSAIDYDAMGVNVSSLSDSLHPDYSPTGTPPPSSEPLTSFLSSLQEDLVKNSDLSSEYSFISAGRELLAIKRFQVLPSSTHSDLLSSVCSEIKTITEADLDDSGSLLVLPSLNLDISTWSQTHIAPHLQSTFSLKTYTTPYPALQLLYKLTPPPSPSTGKPMTVEEERELDEKVDRIYEKAEKQVKEKKEIKRKKKEMKEKKKNALNERPGGGGFGK
ncbi:hypothetical protein TrLO_g13969 [Triparma laevis f. longispina]|uniref:Uncharacterized protein n=1 Tax=Triparma laevis f. longispina TaxID=1714387 RepID=A0A9W7F772_9STRA|nr:hypothetical protein TrLO_g13969 [Triparma laevis f. longispina]